MANKTEEDIRGPATPDGTTASSSTAASGGSAVSSGSGSTQQDHGDAGNGVRALVLVPVLRSPRRAASTTSSDHSDGVAAAAGGAHDPQERLQEAVGLAMAIDLVITGALTVPLSDPRPATLFGRGKIEDLHQQIERDEVELVVVDHAVTPIQQSNLEKAWNCKVLDRTGLILEIFGKRARTKEGTLQVELAHLSYQKGRLVRSWTHLERQRGGAGFLGGPGERQIELDRRMIQERIDAIKKDLEVVVKTRKLHRAGRRRVPYPVVALVGYTNAGKSTLFNLTTGAQVFAKDQVFATLDPTMREIVLASKRRVILSDTVGFISDLPTMLVAAFRATLEEVVEADLILHVRDVSHEHSQAQRADVNKVLSALGLDPRQADTNIIEVWNKIDLLGPEARLELDNVAARLEQKPALISAVTGEGIAQLLEAVETRLGAHDELVTCKVPPHEGALINWLHENTEILARLPDQGHEYVTYNLRMTRENRGRFEAMIKDKDQSLQLRDTKPA